jgi:sugar/nucleoside kinase (ribokinase family)
MHLDVVSFGDLVADMILPIPKLPICPNETQLAHQMLLEPGGAGNFLIMTRRLGLKAAATGCVGSDVYGQMIIEKLQGEGVDTGGLQVLSDQKTTLVMIFIDDAGEHVFLGVLGSFQVTQILPAFAEKVSQARAFFTNGYAFLETAPAQLVIEMMALARQQGKTVFLDPGPQMREIPQKLMRTAIAQADTLLLTQAEAVALVGGETALETAQTLLGMGPKLVVLKMGAEGCLIVNKERCLKIDGFATPLRDTTGAGDAFDAAFVYGILNGMPLEETGRLANAVGACTVSKIGAGTGLPLKTEVADLLGKPGRSFPFPLE